MGFEPPRTVLKLVFEAPELEGLEVRMYVPSLGEFERLTGMAGELAEVVAEGDLTSEQAKEVMSLYDTVAEYMKSWNVTRNGEPVPTTMEGFRTQEVGFLNTIVTSWLGAVGDVDAPLASGSPSLPTPDLSSIPMEPLATSLAS
jgi:hypothetical protein